MAENEENKEIQENLEVAVQETKDIPTENETVFASEDATAKQENQPQEAVEIPAENVEIVVSEDAVAMQENQPQEAMVIPAEGEY